MIRELKLVAVVGPTASGKSALAVDLAKRFGGVVISADSKQIYRGMDIGTTKITKAEMAGIPHYMIDVADVDEEFNVSRYQKTVMKLLEQIEFKNRKRKQPIVPFIVGGTGLYVSSITDGLSFPNVPPNPVLRKRLMAQDLSRLVTQLQKLDPDTEVDIQNKRRVVRAIEMLTAGEGKARKTAPAYPVLKLGLGQDREKLNHRIEERVKRFDLPGLIKETKRLMRKKYDFSSSALSAIGYNDVRDLIEGKTDEAKLLEKLAQRHRQYAKRQMTWFKKDPDIHWVTTPRQAEKLVTTFLEQ